MADQERFMRILLKLAEYAQENGGVLRKSEVDGSFSEMELSKAQYDLIYRYLLEKKISIQGICLAPSNVDDTPSGEEGDGSKDSRYLNLYFKELDGLESLSEDERLSLAMRLLSGDETIMSRLLNASLFEVVSIAREYCGQGGYLEDVIQEGNIALMQVLKEMTGKGQLEEPLAYIREYVRCAIAEYIDGQVTDNDEQERVIAKLGLLHEAAKHMAKENGVLPDAQELANFSKLPVEEVKDLVRLSKNANFFGKDI